MPTYALTGGLGAGKTLVAVGRIQDYLRQGRRVATNLNLDLLKLLPARSIAHVIRLKDFPDAEDFKMIGRGHYVKAPSSKAFISAQNAVDVHIGKLEDDSYSKEEKYNGLLVLDEMAVYFNSRDWNDDRRKGAISWLRHARKLGWDVIFIMQDVESVDKQIRKGLIEHEGVCKRADRLSIPFVGGLLRALGLGFLSRPPRLHVCSVKYGISQHAPVVGRWVYRGLTVQDGYDTNQVFVESTSDKATFPHSVLSPWHVRGRYLPPPFFDQMRDFLSGAKPWRSGYRLKPKHPLVQKIMRLPDPKKRIEFLQRFEACGTFSRGVVCVGQ